MDPPNPDDLWTKPDHTPQVDLNVCPACGEWSDAEPPMQPLDITGRGVEDTAAGVRAWAVRPVAASR